MDPTTVAVPGTARSSGATVRASSDPESRAREAQSAPTRRSGRRRRILLPVLAALGLVLGSAAGYAASGVANSSRSGRTLEPVGIAAYDPFGDDNGHENDDFLPNAIDGKPDTTWRTSGYRSSDFSALKPGVGIIVRLTASSSVGHVRLVSPSRGWSAKIFVAEAVPSDFTGWGASVGSIDNVRSNTTTIQLTKTRGTRVLLWITKLAPKAPSQEFTRVIVQEFSPRT